MALQLSTSVRNARLDQIETTVGASAVLKVFTGAQPANCAAANSGTELVSITCPSDWAAAASGGSKAKSGTWSAAASAGSGATPGHFRLYESTATTCHLQGSCGVGSGDLSFDGTITTGQTVTVSTFTLTDANS